MKLNDSQPTLDEAVAHLKSITLYDLLEQVKKTSGDKVYKQREGLAVFVTSVLMMTATANPKPDTLKLVEALTTYEPSTEFKIRLAHMAIEMTKDNE